MCLFSAINLLRQSNGKPVTGQILFRSITDKISDDRIETQDVLLRQKNVERFIEIGPSDTLVSMTKKTLTKQYKNLDAARHMKRKLLYYGQNVKEIHYDADALPKPNRANAKSNHDTAHCKQKERSTTEGAVAVEITTAPSSSVHSAPAPVSVTTSASSSPACKIDDVPLSAKDVVVSLIAQKLKKSYGEIETNKTIKHLVGGTQHWQLDDVAVTITDISHRQIHSRK
jgi:fatty acid synthase subunit alpha